MTNEQAIIHFKEQLEVFGGEHHEAMKVAIEALEKQKQKQSWQRFREENNMANVCGDNRFEVIAMAKQALLDSTNIDESPDEMKVLNNFLFRCWQMGWLDRYESELKEG